MRLIGVVLAFAAALLVQPAQAQTWPAKPVRIIVSLAAGGTPDIICRLLADRLSVALGQQVVIENRRGARRLYPVLRDGGGAGHQPLYLQDAAL